MRTLPILVIIMALSVHSVAQSKSIQVDICIYGGTSSGVIAAYAAKKAGKSVVLIEPGYRLGGMSSGGLGQTDIGNKYAITGIASDFYKRVGAFYGVAEKWTFEPHVAESIFLSYAKEAKVDVKFGYYIEDAHVSQKAIRHIRVRSVRSWERVKVFAKEFIDCSYEGDLMARAGVSFTVGRESSSLYNENLNGVQLRDKHQFPSGIDPYKIPGQPSSGLLWGISDTKLLPNGSGDRSIQAYNFRLCLTDQPSNRIEISRPLHYDSSRYELLLRIIAKTKPDSLNWQLMHIAPMPNQKTDINNCGGFSSDMIGANLSYPTSDFRTRQKIVEEHREYTKGWLYFIGHDVRVPEKLRNEMMAWGYPKDEFIETDHFSPQLYIREARRMVGGLVMTQHHCEGREVVNDVAGYAAYTMDSHNCQRLVVSGEVRNEGDVQVGGFGPYPVSYRAITPKRNECTNLLVPVCLSASHIAYGSIRMEPVFMVLGESAAIAASLAIDKGQFVQDIDLEFMQRLVKLPVPLGAKPD